MMLTTAVIILNWNGRRLLEEFLPPLVRNTGGQGVRLIVADNGSDDDSVAFVEREFPQVELLRFPENLGFAEGYNRALELTPTDLVVLLNSDVEVTPGWLEPLRAFMERNSKCGACQPKIRSHHNREFFEYAGAAGGYLDKHGYPYCRGRLFGSIEKDEGQYDVAAEPVCWASGAALMVRREAYFDAGGLDPSFFAHMEEIDLCVRMQARGWSVFALPNSVVFHVGGASLNQGNPRKTYLNFRNNLLLLYKNSPRKIAGRRLFLRRLLDTAAFAMFLLKFDIPNARAVLKAHNDFRHMKSAYDNLQPDADFLPTLPGARRDILIDYYILQKRK